MRRNVECISTQCIQFLVGGDGGTEGGRELVGRPAAAGRRKTKVVAARRVHCTGYGAELGKITDL